VFAVKIVDHGHHRGNMVQALAQWWLPVASGEALDVLSWAICPALYHSIRIVFKITSN
jgi:hypothetical protein